MSEQQKMQHTPGPWRPFECKTQYGDPCFEIHWSDIGECVAEIVHEEANARLIAAAPDLLAMLIEVLDKIPLTDSTRDATPTATKARAVIAKAIGEPT